MCRILRSSPEFRRSRSAMCAKSGSKGDRFMVNIGVIGYGYWGPNLVRNFMECERAKVVAVSDGSAERLALAKRRAPGVKLMPSGLDLIHDPEIDAVVIATPVPPHFELAAGALRS